MAGRCNGFGGKTSGGRWGYGGGFKGGRENSGPRQHQRFGGGGGGGGGGNNRSNGYSNGGSY